MRCFVRTDICVSRGKRIGTAKISDGELFGREGISPAHWRVRLRRRGDIRLRHNLCCSAWILLHGWQRDNHMGRRGRMRICKDRFSWAECRGRWGVHWRERQTPVVRGRNFYLRRQNVCAAQTDIRRLRIWRLLRCGKAHDISHASLVRNSAGGRVLRPRWAVLAVEADIRGVGSRAFPR